jgi:predicted permease
MFVLSVLFPVMAIALLGYGSLRFNWLGKPDADTLARFTFSILIPALLFVSTARSEFDPSTALDFLAAYYLVVLAVFVLGVLVAAWLFRYGAEKQAVFAMGCAYSNTTVVGIPVVSQALGEEGLVPLFFIISIQNLVMFTVGTIAAERQHLSSGTVAHAVRSLLKQLLGSPITGSLILGLLVNASGIPVWDPLFNSIELLSRAAVPASLFVLGMSLQQYRLKQAVAPAVAMTLINIVLLPVLVWLSMFHVFNVDPLWAKAGVLASAMPVGVSAYVFANRYNTGHGTVAAGSLLSALCSIGSLSLVLLLLR